MPQIKNGRDCNNGISNQSSPDILSREARILRFAGAHKFADYETTKNLLLQEAKNSLVAGKIIAVPTDTIYGFAALSQNNDALRKLYRTKERDGGKPVAICVGEVSDVSRWAYCDLPDSVLHDLLPGPVTLIFKRKPALNPELNRGVDSIGIRIPESAFIQLLAKTCDQPIALTSANTSGRTSSLSIQDFQELWPRLDLIIDGGVLDQDKERLGSTVIDLTVAGKYSVVRQGCALESTTKKLEKHGLVSSSPATSGDGISPLNAKSKPKIALARLPAFKCYQCHICPFFSASKDDFISHLKSDVHKRRSNGKKIACFSGTCMFMSSKPDKVFQHLSKHDFHFEETNSPACILNIKPRSNLTV